MENAVVKYIGHKLDQIRDEVEDHKGISIAVGAVVVGAVAFIVIRKLLKRKKKSSINDMHDWHSSEGTERRKKHMLDVWHQNTSIVEIPKDIDL